MKPIVKASISFAFLVILIAGLYLFADWFSKFTGYALGEDEKIKLSQCLAGKGAVLYVSSTCFACDKQIELFGEEAIKFLKIESCNNVEDCPELKGVPSWKINGDFYYGKKNFKELQDISKCVIS